MNSSLDHPDDESWHAEPGYSPIVARFLVHAYACLTGAVGGAANYTNAIASIAQCQGHRMSHHQQLCGFFVLSMCAAGQDDCSQAVEWLDTALELAFQLNEYDAIIEILYLRSAANTNLMRFRDAVEDHQDCLAVLRAQTDNDDPTHPEFELAILTQLAGLEAFLGQYHLAEQHLQDARRLIPLVPSSHREAASIEWIQAHLYRWRREPERALRLALGAAEVFIEAGPPASAARVQILVADIALDLAEALPEGADQSIIAALARPHVRLAEDLFREVDDEGGAQLAVLARVRYSRLRRENEDRLAIIEQAANVARRLKSDALLGQVLTTLGDELTALEEVESSLTCYRNALDMLAKSEVPALGLWARRRLLIASEMRLGQNH